MPRQSFAERMAQWGLLKQGLTANAADLAFLEAERTQFTALATSLGALDAQQEALKAQLQQVTQDLNAKIGQMKGLESRLRASLKLMPGAGRRLCLTSGGSWRWRWTIWPSSRSDCSA